MILDNWKDDFVIDFNNQLVDLSNLISTRVRRKSTLKEVPILSPKRPPRRRLYPIVPTIDSIEKDQLTREIDQLVIENSYASRKNNLRESYLLPSIPLLQEEYDQTYSRPRPGTAIFCPASYSRKEEEKIKASSKSDKYGEDGPLHIEVYPGVFSPLRGANETNRAISLGCFKDTSCFDCMARIRCIQDAEYVLCPTCKVISPLLTEKGHGVGLGLLIR